MKQILAYIKLSYKQLLWMVFLMLFVLQVFAVYYEDGKLVREVFDESLSSLSMMYIQIILLISQIKNPKKNINLLLFTFIILAGISGTSIIIIIKTIIAIFFVFYLLDRKINKNLKLIPIKKSKRICSYLIYTSIIIVFSYLFVQSAAYVDKLFNSGDLARFYSGSLKGAFAVLSIYCYRKFNMKKKREEDVTESFVYKTLKGFGGK